MIEACKAKKDRRVETVKEPVVEPAAIVTLAGTVATKGMLLVKVTLMPPVGAGALKVTVPVEGLPPVTVVGFSDTEDNATAGVMVSGAVALTPL